MGGNFLKILKLKAMAVRPLALAFQEVQARQSQLPGAHLSARLGLACALAFGLRPRHALSLSMNRIFTGEKFNSKNFPSHILRWKNRRTCWGDVNHKRTSNVGVIFNSPMPKLVNPSFFSCLPSRIWLGKFLN